MGYCSAYHFTPQQDGNVVGKTEGVAPGCDPIIAEYRSAVQGQLVATLTDALDANLRVQPYPFQRHQARALHQWIDRTIPEAPEQESDVRFHPRRPHGVVKPTPPERAE